MGDDFEISRTSPGPLSLPRPDIQELRQELALKTAVLETSADPIFVLNRDGSIYEVNTAVANVFGYTTQTLIGRDFSERIISPLCQESFRLSFDRLTTTDSGPLAGRKVELSAICSDRREIPIELTLKSIRLEDLTQYVVFVRDVSQIRKTETLMRESEARFRRIFDSNMAPVYFWDIHGNITDANDAFLKLLGYTRKELASRSLSWRSLIPAGYEQLEKQSLEQVLRAGVSSTLEFECIHKDGHLVSVVGAAAMIDGSRERGVCLLIDTSHSRENTRNLRDTAWMLREVLEKVSGYAFVKDTNTQFRYVNPSMAQSLGYTAEEMIGKTAADLGLITYEKHTVADKRVLLTGEPNSIEFVSQRNRLLKVRRTPLRNAKGQIIGIIGTGQDMTDEIKREREYRDSLEILKLISDGVLEGVTLQDPNGKLKFSNATAERILSSYSGGAESLDAKDHWLTMDRAPFPPERRPDRLVLDGAKEAEALLMVRPSGSEERWILQRSVALRDPSGEMTGILSIYRDLTEVRKLEDLNQQQSAAMRATFDALALHDAQGHFVFVNEAHEALYGYSQQELKGKHWTLLYAEDESRRLEAEALPKLAARGSWRGESVARKKDGTLFSQEVSITSTPSGGIVCAIRDLSEQKKEQAAKNILRTVSWQLASTLDCGKRMEQLALLLASEVADFCRIDLLDPEGNLSCAAVSHQPGSGAGPERQRPISRAAQTLQTGEILSVRESEDCQSIQEATGVEARSALIAPLRSRGFSLGSIILVRHSTPPYDLQDFTLLEEIARRVSIAIENSRLYERAQQALASRDDFISAVSHDLKNPLSAILLSTSFLIRTLDKNPENTERDAQVRNQLRSLERSAQRMNKLLVESLDLARIESGRLILDKQEYKIPTLVQEVLEDLTAMAAAKNQTLQKNCSIARLTGLFDRDRIEQVLLTLVTNAIRYAPEGGSIQVTVRQLEKEFLFSVADSGPGIPPEEQNILFDRYRELNTQRVCQGVGLPLSRGIVEAHGGKLWIDVESGPGSTLRFTIPSA